MNTRLTVLTWHNVDPTDFYPARSGVGARGLAGQLGFLTRHAAVIPLAEGLRALRDGRPLPPRAVALTFDDGYRDQLTVAAPLLERFGAPATFFLVPAFLSAEMDVWWERLGWIVGRARTPVVRWRGRVRSLRSWSERRAVVLAASEELRHLPATERRSALDDLADACDPPGTYAHNRMFMDWNGARELVSRGFTVGSHTTTHEILTNLAPSAAAWSLEQSRLLLQQGLQVPIDLLAYPSGTAADFDDTTTRLAAEAGYDFSVTTVAGRNDRSTRAHEVHRFCLQPDRGTPGLAVVPLQPVRRRVPMLRWPGSARQRELPAVPGAVVSQ